MRIDTYLHVYECAEDRNSQAKVEYLILDMHIFNYFYLIMSQVRR
jgi:hypothetical protein